MADAELGHHVLMVFRSRPVLRFRGALRAQLPPAERRPPGRHLAVADLPAARLARDDVVVDDTAGRSVGLNADSLGLDPRRACVDRTDHDVSDVMTDRVGIAQRERGMNISA